MKSSNIGGQAVLEGIMMKHKDAYSVAVRKPDGEIIVQKDEYHSIVGKWKKLTTIPFIRGIFNFIDSMVLGIKTLTYSASFYEEEEEQEKLTEAEALKKEKQEKWLMGGTVAFSVVAAVAIFMVLPYVLSSFLKPLIPSYHIRTVIEGFVRIGIFILYVLLISRMEDIQRTFMYHGAEHKCINCIEHGLPLTVENVKISSRQHKRLSLIHISSQIRKFNLKTGDILEGHTRIKTQQEKFSALLYLTRINEMDPMRAMRRTNFEDMTPIFPDERLRLECGRTVSYTHLRGNAFL